MSLFRRSIRYLARLSYVVVCLLVSHAVGQAWGQTHDADEQVGKTQRRVLERAREGTQQDVIVVFDHTTTQQSIDAQPASNWMFDAPSLLNAGTLESYIRSKALIPLTGFWVDKP